MRLRAAPELAKACERNSCVTVSRNAPGCSCESSSDCTSCSKPIGEQQLIQQLLADSAIEINAARLLLLQAAHAIDQGHDARERISMVKVYASETLGRVADRAVQVFGGMGYCKDLPIERFYRDARIFRIFDGTSEIHRTVIARSMMKHGAARFADVI